MTHGSLFAGIGGFDLGFERAGWRTVWQVEQEPFCRKVLASRFPGTERMEDVRHVGADNLSPVDCITAGVPCQDVSVAGKRAGLAGERTGLFYEFARILRELRPAWFVFENVPGLLSSNRGRDFAEVLRVLMVECGYGVAWRVLNSQFFGVAQRRRRVFIVGRFGEPCPAEVLFEPESGAGDSEAGSEAGQDVAFALAASVRGTGDGHGQGWNSNYAVAANLQGGGHSGEPEPGANLIVSRDAVPKTAGGLCTDLRSGNPHPSIVAQPLRTNPYNNSDSGMEAKQLIVQQAISSIGIREGGPSYTLDGTSQHAVAFRHDADNQQGQLQQPATGRSLPSTERISASAGSGDGHERAPPDSHGVREFTRLPAGLDSARYRALGNAVTVQVAEWIARRIRAVTR